MTLEQIIGVLKVFRQEDAKAEEFLASIPMSINQVFFETPYIQARERIIDVMLVAITSQYQCLYDDIQWFLYEMRDNNRTFWMADETEVTITSDEDYYNYLRSEYAIASRN